MSSPSSVLPDQGLAAPRGKNPYVGPRSIQPGEKIYGRKRETAEVRDRLIADRIVLMYSPSGAGKTSLINAGLRPELESRGFVVLPTIRINHVDDDVGRPAGYNRYRLSLMQSLEEGRTEDQRIAHAALSSMSLADYFAQIAARHDESGDLCLVFDQFEELLTLDSSDLQAKDDFMEELGLVLRDRRWWVLFSMREDFVAPLDPYLDFMPTRLSSHYRLELLSAVAATVAARAAAAQSGVHFAEDAANKLINDLRLVRVQRGDEIVETPGAYVEPVQLQVVCSQLWTRLSPTARTIELADVESLGNVDDALAEYYEQRVGAAASDSGISEREIRQWIEEALITEQGFRTQSLAWPREGGDMVLASLENSHLVRTETHRGARWYELAHDRLVDPIRTANETWRSSHLSLLQVRSGEWYQHEKPTGLLIGGKVLAEAEVWAAEHPAELNDIDREYLAKSRVMEESARRLRRSSRRNLILAVFAVIGLVIALLAWRSAQESERRAEAEAANARTAEAVARAAEDQAKLDRDEADRLKIVAEGERDIAEALRAVAEASALAARSRSVQLENPALALAVAAESTGVADNGTPQSAFAAIASARSAFSELSWQPGSGGVDQAGARQVAVSPDGTTFASAGCARPTEPCDRRPADTIYLRSVADPTGEPQALTGHRGEILDMAYNVDGRLVSTSADGDVRLWDTTTGDSAAFSTPGGDVVDALGFGPDNPALLVTGDRGGNVVLWDLAGDQPSPTVFDRSGLDLPERVEDVTIRFDGKLIASAESNGNVVLWDATVGRPLRLLQAPQLTSDDGQVLPRGAALTVEFFPDPRPIPCPETEVPYQPDCVDALVVGHDQGNLWLWESPNRQDGVDPAAVLIQGHTGAIRNLAFDMPDDAGTAVLASASDDRTIRLWKLEKVAPGKTDSGARRVTIVGEPLAAHRSAVTDVAFSPDGGRLVSTSDDNTVRLWGAPDDTAVGVRGLGEPLDCSDCTATAIAFSSDELLASAGTERTSDGDAAWFIRFWDPQTGQPEAGLDRVAAPGPVHALDFHPEADVLIVGALDGAFLWSRTDPAQLQPLVTDGDPTQAAAVRAVAFDDTTAFAATADEAGMIRIYDPATLEQVDGLDTSLAPAIGDADADADEARPVRALTFVDGFLLYGDAEGCIWKIPFDDGQLGSIDDRTQVGEDQDGIIRGLDVNDGFVAAASSDQTIQISKLDDAEDREPASLRGHQGEVGAVAFSDSYLASAGDDGTIRLWWLNERTRQTDDRTRIDHAPATGEVLQTGQRCRGSDGCRVVGLAFNDDGSMLAATTSDGQVHIWDDLIDPDVACALARPFITRDQLVDEIDREPKVCAAAWAAAIDG